MIVVVVAVAFLLASVLAGVWWFGVLWVAAGLVVVPWVHRMVDR